MTPEANILNEYNQANVVFHYQEIFLLLKIMYVQTKTLIINNFILALFSTLENKG